jgi:hypothetical protein
VHYTTQTSFSGWPPSGGILANPHPEPRRGGDTDTAGAVPSTQPGTTCGSYSAGSQRSDCADYGQAGGGVRSSRLGARGLSHRRALGTGPTPPGSTAQGGQHVHHYQAHHEHSWPASSLRRAVAALQSCGAQRDRAPEAFRVYTMGQSNSVAAAVAAAAVAGLLALQACGDAAPRARWLPLLQSRPVTHRATAHHTAPPAYPPHLSAAAQQECQPQDTEPWVAVGFPSTRLYYKLRLRSRSRFYSGNDSSCTRTAAASSR